MSYVVDFTTVSTTGLESSPVAAALAGLRANEARYFKNKYGHAFTVEPVVGHAAIARQGLARALEGLIDAGWLPRTEAIELVPGLMHGNARRIFRLAEKEQALRNAPWRK